MTTIVSRERTVLRALIRHHMEDWAITLTILAVGSAVIVWKDSPSARRLDAEQRNGGGLMR